MNNLFGPDSPYREKFEQWLKTGEPFEIPVSELALVDVTHKLLGKYQYCTEYQGAMYADTDFDGGMGVGKPKPGAIPFNRRNSG